MSVMHFEMRLQSAVGEFYQHCNGLQSAVGEFYQHCNGLLPDSRLLLANSNLMIKLNSTESLCMSGRSDAIFKVCSEL